MKDKQRSFDKHAKKVSVKPKKNKLKDKSFLWLDDIDTRREEIKHKIARKVIKARILKPKDKVTISLEGIVNQRFKLFPDLYEVMVDNRMIVVDKKYLKKV